MYTTCMGMQRTTHVRMQRTTHVHSFVYYVPCYQGTLRDWKLVLLAPWVMCIVVIVRSYYVHQQQHTYDKECERLCN